MGARLKALVKITAMRLPATTTVSASRPQRQHGIGEIVIRAVQQPSHSAVPIPIQILLVELQRIHIGAIGAKGGIARGHGTHPLSVPTTPVRAIPRPTETSNGGSGWATASAVL